MKDFLKNIGLLIALVLIFINLAGFGVGIAEGLYGKKDHSICKFDIVLDLIVPGGILGCVVGELLATPLSK
jgi:hypothetical protein